MDYKRPKGVRYRGDEPTICPLSMASPEPKLCYMGGDPNQDPVIPPCEAWNEKSQRCMLMVFELISFNIMRIAEKMLGNVWQGKTKWRSKNKEDNNERNDEGNEGF